MTRREQRREAVFALYQHDVTGKSLDEVLNPGARSFTKALVNGVLTHQKEFDQLIAENAQGWSLDRIATLEKAIMRVALLELIYPEEVPAERQIPFEVAMDEAIETAKEFCGADAPGFINGILAAVQTKQSEPSNE